MIGNVKFADLLNRYLRNVLGCSLMASSQLLLKNIGVCLSALPPTQQDHKNHSVCKVIWFQPPTPEPRANLDVTLGAQAACFHVWLMLARCSNVVYILKVLVSLNCCSTLAWRQWVTISSYICKCCVPSVAVSNVKEPVLELVWKVQVLTIINWEQALENGVW